MLTYLRPFPVRDETSSCRMFLVLGSRVEAPLAAKDRLCRLLTSIEHGVSSHVLTLWTVSQRTFSDTGSRVVEPTHDGCQVSRAT